MLLKESCKKYNALTAERLPQVDTYIPNLKHSGSVKKKLKAF